VAIIIIYFVRGYMKGVIVAVFSLLAVVLGIIVALRLSGLLAAWLLEKELVTSGWGQLISYAIIFTGVMLLVRLLARAVEKTLQIAALGWINRIAGGLMFSFLAALVISSVLWLCSAMHLFSPETIRASKMFPYLEPIAPWVYGKLGTILPFIKDLFADMQQLFDQMDTKAAKDVDTHR
ncbi:MAG: CvpA family protein, partial [Sphingobacteriales bacterium]